MIDFYCHPTCTTCKKAEKWLKQEQQEYRFVNLKETAPTKDTLVKAMNDSGKTVRQFFNTSGNRYRELGLKETVSSMDAEEAAELLAMDGMLIKRPLAIQGDKVTVGFKESDYIDVWQND